MLLDLAKAFDSVSHRHIVAALRRHGVAEEFISVIEDMYLDATTFFQLCAGDTCQIPILCGVKQGDPLSPLLFNLAMDPLLTLLEEAGEGVDVGGFSLCSLAYADDTALVSSSRDGMARNLSMTMEFLAICGLSINVRKSSGFLISPGGNSFVVNNGEPWTIGDEPIPWLKEGDTATYLGARIGSWTNTWPSIKVVARKLEDWCKKISTAPLKPRQKVTILTEHAVPRLEYDLAVGGYSRTAIRYLDGIIRSNVKRWYHLAVSVSKHFLYSRTRDGGCGLPCLADSIPMARMRVLSKVGRSSDEVIKGISIHLGVERRIAQIAERTSLPVPSPHGYNAGWRGLHLQKWESLGPQKRGVDCYRNPIVNKWLRGRSFLSEREFLCALKLRSNTLPTKETLCRGRRGMSVLCRRCGRSVETTGHISGACTSVLPERIARHDRVCTSLQQAAIAVGLGVTVEPTIKAPGGARYRPDLILRGEDTIYIVDPTVVWDGDMARLDAAHREKVRKYQAIVPTVQALYGGLQVEVHGFVIGARGTWTPLNDDVANVLGLKNGQIQRLCQIALCDTIKLVQTFFDL